jgi:flagellar protein FliS
MKEDKVKEYSRRISQCTKTELVVITDEIIITYLNEAKELFAQGNMKEFCFSVKKAGQFIDELSGSLDMKYQVSMELMSLYVYVKKIVLQAEIRKQMDRLEEVIRIMEQLKRAFEEVAKQDTSGKMIEGSKKVYAGLTYGPGSKLNEVVY